LAGEALASRGLDSAYSLRSRRVAPLGYFNNIVVVGGRGGPAPTTQGAGAMQPRRQDQGKRKKRGAPTAATIAKRADNKAVKISAKAATQAAKAEMNGSALLASLGVVPAATPQAPPVMASTTAAQAQQQPPRSQRWLVRLRQSQWRQTQRWPRPQPLRRLHRRWSQANEPLSGGPMPCRQTSWRSSTTTRS
jgi:hypothetical protein